MAEKGSKTSRSKSLSDELLKDDFFKPPVDEIMEEDVSGEAGEEVLSTDDALEEPGGAAGGEKSDLDKGVPVKYLIIGGAGLLVIVVLVLLYFLVLSGPKIQPAAVPPAPTAPVAQVPAQPSAPANVPAPAPQVTPPSTPAPAPVPPAIQPSAPSVPASPPPAAAPAPPPKPEPKPVQVAAVPRFTLNLGVFANEADRKASQAKIKSLGWEAVTEEKAVTSAKYFIFLNEKLTPGQAKANSLKLKMLQKIENAIIPQADGTAKVRVGPFPDKEQATATMSKMTGAGFPSEIQAEQIEAKGYILKAGRFATREEANQAVSTLKQKGLKAEIVNLE